MARSYRTCLLPSKKYIYKDIWKKKNISKLENVSVTVNINECEYSEQDDNIFTLLRLIYYLD